MSFERLKVWSRTLRFRLMVWNTGLVLLVAIAALLALREAITFALHRDVDDTLVEDIKEIRQTLEGPRAPSQEELHADLDRKALAHEQHRWHVRFLDAKGTRLWSSVGAPEELAVDDPQENRAPVSFNGYRIVRQQFRGPDGLPSTVIVGSSELVLRETTEKIDRLIAIVAAILLVTAPLGGYWLAGRATRPLADMIHTTSRLRPSRLKERLPLRNTQDELDQLAQTVNRMLDRIAMYIQTKRDFIANSAHELRSPLAAIRSSVEVALNSGRTAAEYEELLAEIIEECTTLESLVNQLLLLAETDADRLKIHREAVRFDELLRKGVDMFRGVAESRDIALTLTPPPLPAAIVNGNPQHLRQVVNNLVDNAIKFTPDGGRVDVRFQLDARGKEAILTVTDTGIGISEHDQPQIFDRFFRADRSRTRDPGISGSGLGLSICQAVVTAHEGEITVSSQLGKGTTFRVMLPLVTDLEPLPDTPPSFEKVQVQP
jgi:heavy metal sensor kinase